MIIVNIEMGYSSNNDEKKIFKDNLDQNLWRFESCKGMNYTFYNKNIKMFHFISKKNKIDTLEIICRQLNNICSRGEITFTEFNENDPKYTGINFENDFYEINENLAISILNIIEEEENDLHYELHSTIRGVHIMNSYNKQEKYSLRLIKN